MAKKQRVLIKRFETADGELSAHAGPEVVALVFFAPAEGDDGKVTMGEEIARVTQEGVGEKCWAASAWHGLSQKVGDAYAGKETEEASEIVETMIERLANDDWVREREGAGPRPSMVLEAVIRVLAKRGKDLDESAQKELAEKLSTPAARKAILEGEPEVAVAYAEIQAERLAEKIAKAKEKAAKHEGESILDKLA